MEFFRVETEQQARDLCQIMPEVIAVDTEYVKGDPRTTKLLSVIVADDNRAWAVSPSLLPTLTPTLKSRKLVFLQDYNHCDTIILLKNGCDLRETNCHNLIDMHHLLDDNAEHSLDARVKLMAGDDYKSVFWSKYKNYEDAPAEEALEYACKDAIYTYRLGKSDFVAVMEDDNLRPLYEHTRKLSAALLDTELNGLNVNVPLMVEVKTETEGMINDWLVKLRKDYNDYCRVWEFEKHSKDIEKWASKLKTEPSVDQRLRIKRPTFSFESDKQIAWLVYEALGLPVLNKTKTGNPSVDFETLQSLATDRPDLQPLVDYKDVKAVYATFIKGMLERVQDSKIYPSFNVSGTSTGRISHSNPNMGNLPKTGRIRNFFIPSPGMCIIGADYAQLEVVVELNLTDDPGLKEIVCGGASKHDLFKADLDKAGFNIPRSQVKNINFALQYGAGANKIAKMVGCSSLEANKIIDTFYQRFSGVKALKEQTNSTLLRDGYITNLAGRSRRFSPAKNKYELFRQQRQAYNFLIQGVAAEACNRAYYRFANWCQEFKHGRAMFPVHDEIVAEVWANQAEQCKQNLELIMEQSTQDFGFKYPLTAKAYGPLDKWEKT
jgi:DNA polymerase I-like protein with 3'-5' exonuclease and polymerase domains